MCYWMMEKRSGAAKTSTEGKMAASGKTEKITPTEEAATSGYQLKEKAHPDFKGHIESPVVKEREEESIS